MSEFAPSRFHGASGRNVVVCSDNKIKIIDDEGQEIVGVVVDVEAEFVHVDFNHPLAGLDLHFEGVVVGISG